MPQMMWNALFVGLIACQSVVIVLMLLELSGLKKKP